MKNTPDARGEEDTTETGRYQCNECDAVHDTFDAAANCHFGISGVVDLDPYDKLIDAVHYANAAIEHDWPTDRLVAALSEALVLALRQVPQWTYHGPAFDGIEYTRRYVGGLGVDWCLLHNGVINADSLFCDMHEQVDGDDDCVHRTLVYIEDER